MELTDRRKQQFDRTLSRARCIVECAFGKLKARWRFLSSRLHVSEDVVFVAVACVILHNICEDRGHDASWEPRGPLQRLPLVIPYTNKMAHELDRRQFMAGTRACDAIADYLVISAFDRRLTYFKYLCLFPVIQCMYSCLTSLC